VGLFLLVTLGWLAPVLPALGTRALGHPGNDVWNHIWGYWEVAQSLTAGHLPIHTDLLAWPHGGALWFIDTFDAVLTLPIQWLAGPVVAYNLGIGLNVLLCGIGAYVLALDVSASWAGALFAGVAYMSAPHLLGQAYNGITETMAAGWLPLAIAACRRATHDPRPGRAALAGLAFGLNAVANWYYGMFAGIALGGLLLRALAALPGSPAAGRRVQRGAFALLVGALVTGLVVAGPFLLFLQSMAAPDAIVTRDPSFVWMTLVMHNMTDVVALFHPGRFYSPDLKAAFDEDLIVVIYLGFSLLVPAAIALLGPLRRRAGSWGALTLVYLVLTLGPFLYVGGRYLVVDGRWLPLPFLALFKWFPLFSRISHAYRFSLAVTLGLAVLSSLAIAAAERRGRRAGLAVGALIFARLVETAGLSSAVVPIPWSDTSLAPIYHQLTGGAVLDLPVTMPVLARSQWIISQLSHGQPIPYGLNDPLPYYLYVNHYTRYLVELERSQVALLPPVVPSLDLVAGRAEATSRGLRWIVIHKDAYPTAQYRKVAQLLDETATAFYDDDALRIYRLDGAG